MGWGRSQVQAVGVELRGPGRSKVAEARRGGNKPPQCTPGLCHQ